MADDRVTPLDGFDGAADLLDPARVLVPHDVGQLDGNHAAPEPFNHVQIGAADAGAADPHDYVRGLFDFRLRYFLVANEVGPLQRFIVVDEEPQLSSYETAFRKSFDRVRP